MDLSERRRNLARRHPWESARARFFEALVARATDPSRALRVVDAGAGDGYFASRLASRLPEGSRVVAWDASYSDDDLVDLAALHPRVAFVRERPEGRFDLVLALDVLEHVDDDAAFARTLAELAAPGGRVVVSVPAWPGLFSRHDVALGHHRRYRPEALLAVLRGAGLVPVESGGLFHGLCVARAATKACETLGLSRGAPALAGDWTGGALATFAIDATLGVETHASAWLARAGLRVPGLSFWASCAK